MIPLELPCAGNINNKTDIIICSGVVALYQMFGKKNGGWHSWLLRTYQGILRSGRLRALPPGGLAFDTAVLKKSTAGGRSVQPAERRTTKKSTNPSGCRVV